MSFGGVEGGVYEGGRYDWVGLVVVVVMVMVMFGVVQMMMTG